MQTLDDACKARWVKQTEENLPQDASSVRVIADEIWCCCGDAHIAVYDEDLKWKRGIQLTGAETGGNPVVVHDVAMMPQGELIIAGTNGLYHTDMSGKTT